MATTAGGAVAAEAAVTVAHTQATVRRSTVRLAFGQAVVSATIPLGATFGTVEARHLSHHVALAGSVVAAQMLAGAAALLVAGRVSDRHGRRPALAAGFVLLAAGAGVIGAAVALGSYTLLIAGSILFGFGAQPALMGRAAAADLYPAALRARGVGLVASAGVFGAISGPVLASGAVALGPLVGAGSHAPPWLAAIPTCLVAAAVIWSIRPDPKAVAADLEAWWPGMADPPTDHLPARSRRQLLRLRPARRALLAAVAAQATMLAVMSVTAAELDRRGADDVVISLLMSAHFIGMFAFAAPIGLAADRYGRRAVILVGAVVCALGAITTPLTVGSVLVAPCFLLLGLGWCGSFVAGTTVLADVARADERGRLVSTNDLCVAAAGGLAALAAGPLLSSIGFVGVGAVAAAVSLSGLVLGAGIPERAPGRYSEPASAS
jgi:MFS family permease